MDTTLDALSIQEIWLHDEAVATTGPMEQIDLQLRERGIFDEYKHLHQQYLAFFDGTSEPAVKLEALKRLTFLNWYAMVEPSCFTGIGELDEKVVYAAFVRLNTYIVQHQLDHELHWMLSYYSCWDWVILTYSEPNLIALSAFVNSVDTSICHFKQNQPALMGNRGQMGIYWQSHGIGR